MLGRFRWRGGVEVGRDGHRSADVKLLFTEPLFSPSAVRTPSATASVPPQPPCVPPLPPPASRIRRPARRLRTPPSIPIFFTPGLQSLWVTPAATVGVVADEVAIGAYELEDAKLELSTVQCGLVGRCRRRLEAVGRQSKVELAQHQLAAGVASSSTIRKRRTERRLEVGQHRGKARIW